MEDKGSPATKAQAMVTRAQSKKEKQNMRPLGMSGLVQEIEELKGKELAQA